MIRAALIDVGGTLLPDNRPLAPDAVEARLQRIQAVLPELEREGCEEIIGKLNASVARAAGGLVEHSDTQTAAIVESARPGLGGRAQAVRHAMVSPADRSILFPHAGELLATVKELGWRCVIVSNTAWTDGPDYMDRLLVHGLAKHVDGLISSFDLGLRKPHQAMFEAAMQQAGCAPGQCVMVGDSETKDVVPCKAMGMTVIRVAIQEPVAERSQADAVVGSLTEAARFLRSLAASV